MRVRHLVLAAGLLALPVSARADQRTELETAKTLGTEALKLFDAGDYEKALAKFDEADSHARVPTLDLFAARCLDKLHRLIAAKARYEDVTRAILPVGSSQKWLDAQEDAKKELAALQDRIPTLTVHVTGAGDRKLTLSIDGKDQRPEVPQEIDPGSHSVVVIVSNKPYTRDVELAEGDKKTEEIVVEAEKATPPPPAPVTPPPQGPSALVIAGASTLSVGLAGLLLWGTTGGAALGVASSAGCSGSACTGDISVLSALRTSSTVGFYVGVPLTLLGGTLLVVSATTKHGAKTSASVGPGRMSFEMSFD